MIFFVLMRFLLDEFFMVYVVRVYGVLMNFIKVVFFFIFFFSDESICFMKGRDWFGLFSVFKFWIFLRV